MTSPRPDTPVSAADRAASHFTYIIGTYPLLTTTFIDREIELLRSRGMRVDVVAIRRPTAEISRHQRELQSTVRYLLPVGLGALIRAHLRFARTAAYWRTLIWLLSRPHRSPGKRAKTLLHFGEAVHAAAVVSAEGVRHVHAHFIDRAATVALVISRLLDVPYSVTAHANDIYVDPVMLSEKIAGAEFVATCTEFNRTHLASLVAPEVAGRIARVYHGLDVSLYDARRDPEPGPPVLLAVGQLREKKGFTYLIGAADVLRRSGYEFKVEIVGEGPLRHHLQAEIDDHGLTDVITLRGALPHDQVVEHFRKASIFVLPCVTGADGDRDGIPNVILEAMAMGLAVVSSDHSGIPEAVTPSETGILVQPRDVAGLAEALARLLDNPGTARAMGERGRTAVAEQFDVATNVELLRTRLSGGRDE